MDPCPSYPIAVPSCREHSTQCYCDPTPDLCTPVTANGSWLELEEFWGNEKHRLQLENQVQQLSSSLERQLLFDDCLKKPLEVVEAQPRAKDTPPLCTSSSCLLRGEDINDIPTSYLISGLEKYEFPVIGTYVDKRVVPGFKYKVRLVGTDKFLFNGRGLRLERVGMGYGKRLTFEDTSLNRADNYFWSDSHPGGYGFSLEAVAVNDSFVIKDLTSGSCIGRAEVTSCTGGQVETGMTIRADGVIEKIVSVEFQCRIYPDKPEEGLKEEETSVSGEVLIVKQNSRQPARVASIKVGSSVHPNCEFVPAAPNRALSKY